ncbi:MULTISPECIES: TetR/AcrR family transcriptional regulator [Rhizobium]|uniref:Transcriptional regulator, TetR family n=1 Tax=Rhizobium miluonense TaxID=411945 RepID=A0A1C3X3I3_9HYPH|nr:TetR/AcrR family transcriptional regulator [Rhizobium miluonense]SCB46813.1 transcriptional regulator, TetR family [Rhizobium miluonense]
MVEIQLIEKRSRGRPQIRCDDDTKSLIIEAADTQFRENGYAATSINAIAQTAGVSTKTLYRLFPAKADLLSSIISDRINRFFLALDQSTLATMDLREGLERLLTAYGMLTMSDDTVDMMRLIIAESDRFPEIAKSFYETAIVGSNAVMEKWLTTQVERGLIKLEDPHMASGMLRGMMIMEPQRAAILRQQKTPGIDEIAQRARICADIFLKGCQI